MNLAKIWLSMCANGSVRFARYCGKMHSRHLFPYGGLVKANTKMAIWKLKTLICRFGCFSYGFSYALLLFRSPNQDAVWKASKRFSRLFRWNENWIEEKDENRTMWLVTSHHSDRVTDGLSLSSARRRAWKIVTFNPKNSWKIVKTVQWQWEETTVRGGQKIQKKLYILHECLGGIWANCFFVARNRQTLIYILTDTPHVRLVKKKTMNSSRMCYNLTQQNSWIVFFRYAFKASFTF